MKKAMFFLLAFGLFLMPMTAFAVTMKGSIPQNEMQEVTNSDGTTTKTYNVYVTVDKGDDTGAITNTNFDFDFEYGAAIKSFTCGDTGNFVAAESTTGEKNKKCSFSIKEGNEVTEGKQKVGVLTLIVNKDAKNEDCYVNFSFAGAQGKINPNTGVNIPYAYIAGGLFVAAVVYFATKKRTKLYKI